MSELDATRRARLPNSAFAYVDSRGHRRLPIHDEAHVRNALARFNQVRFEDDAARERARERLLRAARRYGIVPIGFFAGQLRAQRRRGDAAALVVDLGTASDPATFEARLREILGDPTLQVLRWSAAAEGYADRNGLATDLPAPDAGRAVTLIDRHGSPMTALVHDPLAVRDASLVQAVTAAVRLAVENELLHAEAAEQSRATAGLPTGTVTFLMSDIEGSTRLLRRLGDRYATLLADVRAVLRSEVRRAGGHEVDARADEYFAAFVEARAALAAAIAIDRRLALGPWPEGLEVRVRIGIHAGRPVLTGAGYVGLDVHATARVCAAAHGGQIIVSDGARALLGGAPDGTALAPLGDYRLRGLPGTTTLFQLTAPGLPGGFPPLRAARAADDPADPPLSL